ncbi:MAG: hypothetical protein WAL41_27760 [Mycobacterium sp.]
MTKVGLLSLIVAVAALLGGTATAQSTGDEAAYFVAYYSNANTAEAPDGVVRLINDGSQATWESEGQLNGTLWAAIYVFDDSQELQSCCACEVTADGLLSESVNKQLTANTFTGNKLTRGVIKIVSSSCGDPTHPVVASGLRGWFTTVDAATNIPSKGPFYVTRTELHDANLGGVELENLGTLCSYGLTIGSGKGLCSCTPEDQDF